LNIAGKPEMEVDRLNAAKTGERAVIVRLNFNCFKFQSKIGSTAEMKWRLLLDNSKTKGIVQLSNSGQVWSEFPRTELCWIFFGVSILVFFLKKISTRRHLINAIL
jgi:hypothetical protein